MLTFVFLSTLVLFASAAQQVTFVGSGCDASSSRPSEQVTSRLGKGSDGPTVAALLAFSNVTYTCSSTNVWTVSKEVGTLFDMSCLVASNPQGMPYHALILLFLKA
jgi:hypothetical protein